MVVAVYNITVPVPRAIVDVVRVLVEGMFVAFDMTIQPALYLEECICIPI